MIEDLIINYPKYTTIDHLPMEDTSDKVGSLYYNTSNSRKYRGEDVQYIELEDDQAPVIEDLITQGNKI